MQLQTFRPKTTITEKTRSSSWQWRHFRHHEKEDRHIRVVDRSVDVLNSQYFEDGFDIVSRRSRLDGEMQSVGISYLIESALDCKQNSTTQYNPWTRCIYDTMRRSLYWSHMANYVFYYVGICQSCKRHQQHPTHRLHLKLFPSEAPFQFVAMGILRFLLKTKTNNKCIVLMKERHSKLTRTIPSKQTTTTDLKRILVANWAVMFRISDRLLTVGSPNHLE